mgnify:CR=1 FL=1
MHANGRYLEFICYIVVVVTVVIVVLVVVVVMLMVLVEMMIMEVQFLIDVQHSILFTFVVASCCSGVCGHCDCAHCVWSCHSHWRQTRQSGKGSQFNRIYG